MEFNYKQYIPEVIVSLSFVNASNASEFTKAKQYKYLIDHNVAKKLIKDIDNYHSAWRVQPLFKIENEGGYNYRGSKVIIHRVDFFTDVAEFRKFRSSSPNLVRLKKIIVVDEKAPIKCDYFVDNLNERELKLIDSFYKSASTKISDSFSNLSGTTIETTQSLIDLSTVLKNRPIYADNTNSLALGSCSMEPNSLNVNLDTCKSFTISFKNGDSIMTITPDSLNISCENNNNNNNKERGNNMFKNVMKDFYCGPATDVKMSIYGPAFRAISEGGERVSETYVAYHKSEYIDVMDGLLDIGNCAYVMPVAAKTVKKGDFIRHCGGWVRVLSIEEDTIEGENVNTRTIIKIRPTKNMFGFNFYSKLITFDIMNGTSEDNPFGNILPMLLLGGNNSKMSDILPFMMMTNKDFDMNNPMMMYFLMNKNGSNSNTDLMMATMMGQFMNNNKEKEKEKEKE